MTCGYPGTTPAFFVSAHSNGLGFLLVFHYLLESKGLIGASFTVLVSAKSKGLRALCLKTPF